MVHSGAEERGRKVPIYEYQCDQCGNRTEAIQRLDEPPLEICPHCGGPLRKLMSAPSFQFKGSGWYVTDYADKGRKDGKEAEKPSKSASTDAKGAKEPSKQSSKESSKQSSSDATDTS